MGKFLESLGDELILYVRQNAWLNAVPEAPPAVKGRPPPKREEMSRRDRFIKEKIEIEMPPVAAGAHLLGHLFEIGPTMPAGQGNGPITWAEMDRWSDLTGNELQPWEYSTLRRLSNEYLAESYRATKRDARAPVQAGRPRTVEEARAAQRVIDRRLDAFLD